MERAGAPNQAKYVIKSKSPRAGGLQIGSASNFTRKAMHQGITQDLTLQGAQRRVRDQSNNNNNRSNNRSNNRYADTGQNNNISNNSFINQQP